MVHVWVVLLSTAPSGGNEQFLLHLMSCNSVTTQTWANLTPNTLNQTCLSAAAKTRGRVKLPNKADLSSQSRSIAHELQSGRAASLSALSPHQIFISSKTLWLRPRRGQRVPADTNTARAVILSTPPLSSALGPSAALCTHSLAWCCRPGGGSPGHYRILIQSCRALEGRSLWGNSPGREQSWGGTNLLFWADDAQNESLLLSSSWLWDAESVAETQQPLCLSANNHLQ